LSGAAGAFSGAGAAFSGAGAAGGFFSSGFWHPVRVNENINRMQKSNTSIRFIFTSFFQLLKQAGLHG